LRPDRRVRVEFSTSRDEDGDDGVPSMWL